MGYKSHAHFVLDENMLKPQRSIRSFNSTLETCSKRAKAELADMQAIADSEAKNLK